MSGSKTIIDDERLPNPHPGEFLREDFLIGSQIDLIEVAEGAGIPADRLTDLLSEKIAVDADTDLRLARYFGMSEGFFLGLQADFDLEEARRANGAELDKIVRRAA
jgi:addiction module HigA family antidote